MTAAPARRGLVAAAALPLAAVAARLLAAAAARLLAASAACLLAASAVGAAPLSLADAFRPPAILSMRLSGDGRHLAAVVAKDKSVAVLLIDCATLTPKVLPRAWTGVPRGVQWVGEDVLALATTSQTTLYDGEGATLRQVNGRLLAGLRPDADGHERIVVADARDAVTRIDVRTGASTTTPFEWPEGLPSRWLMDRDGVPRVATTLSRDRTMLTHWVRASAAEPWQKVESQLAVDPRWRPVGLQTEPGTHQSPVLRDVLRRIL